MADDTWSDEDDMALYKYIQKRASEFRCGPPEQVLDESSEGAWVLIFNPGLKNEGVYTLQGRALPSVLAFESMMDADRFARSLAAEGFHSPTPMKWRNDQLSSFCTAGKFEVSLVPMGAEITPPTENTYDLDAFEHQEEQRKDGLDPVDGLDDEMTTRRMMLERMMRDQGPPRDGPF